jgi:deoxyribodipyrimidine photo-lyase
MKQGIAIHWFRQDLRISDNPALSQAAIYEYVLPIYILDDVNAGNCKWELRVSCGCTMR